MIEQENNDLITVEIHGEKYSVGAQAGNSEYIQQVAAYVDKIMTELKHQYPTNSVTRLAVLAALNITDELLTLKNEKESLVEKYEEKARQISEHLEKVMIDE